jgi:hypothetical protein
LGSLCGALTYKFGYGTDQEKFKQEAHKFSLLNDGTLAKPCTKLFLVNVSVYRLLQCGQTILTGTGE